MSTSERYLAGWPDAEELQRLANAWFQLPPGRTELPLETASPLDEHGLARASVPNLNDPPSSLSDPHGVALDAPRLDVPVSSTPGVLPPSVAGRGVSPSTLSQSVAPLQPDSSQQTLSSPIALESGHIPASWPTYGAKGQSYGATPGLLQDSVEPLALGDDANNLSQELPYAQPQAFDAEILQRLEATGSAGRWAPQLPLSSVGHAARSGFYFVDEHLVGAFGGVALLPGSQLAQAQTTDGLAGDVRKTAASSAARLDVQALRRDFPALQERVHGRPLVWLDNAATTHKPQCVIDRLHHFYAHENSNIHRAAHQMAARATDAYEGARETVRAFVNARSTAEIVFTRGATEAINLVAQTWGRQHIQQGDEIIVSALEHHANIVPWHRLVSEKGAHLKVIPVNDDGELLLDEYARLITPRTKLVTFTQVSNALGTVTPAAQVVEMAHAAGAVVLLDGAQSISHMKVDLQALAPDFFVFSGHKVFGPTGIGVLYGREELLNSLPPWQGGGNMIQDVTFERVQYQPAPHRFEAGTGNIADAVGLGAALDYVSRIGIEAICRYEQDLLLYATRLLREVPGLRLVGTAAHKASVLSFILSGYRTEEVGVALDEVGIAVRSGHHCAQPILRRMGVESTVRPSLAFYNTQAEVDLLVCTLQRLQSAKHRIY